MTKKKFILKPGNHQFIPGSHPIHNNENLDDEEAQWYLKAYPHIANLFERIPNHEELIELKMQSDVESLAQLQSVQSRNQSVKSEQKSVKSQNQTNEDLPTTN
jgi:hypothetical protein